MTTTRMRNAALSLIVLATVAGGCSTAPGSEPEDGDSVASLRDGPDGSDAKPTTGVDPVEEFLRKQQSFVDCVRDNGYPEMQDPDEFGAFAGSDLMAMQGDVARRVMTACRPIIENNKMPPELQERLAEIAASRMTPEQKQEEIEFASCMQENGVPDYPDPMPNGMPREPAWEEFGSALPTPPGLSRAKDACLPLRRGGPDEGAE